ncbi:MAG: alpha/beta hydrolase-fold protein [Verrucomicrobia bacterium]|nr:alpha/beta hydrolase-fold protein [Verrucomicrobiota bacterium]
MKPPSLRPLVGPAFVALLSLGLFPLPSASAQSAPPAPAAPSAPAPRPAPIVSPEVNADRSVTFRLRAPNAKQVTVRGQWAKDPLPLTRADDGLWSATAPAEAIAPGVWEYSFNVDGLAMIDPGNPAIKPMREPRTSILHLPAATPAPWDFQDVPHGTVHQHSYLSKSLGRAREVWVYTPPGYESSATTEKYPLLVLQHGSGDNQQTWVAHGKAHWILDSLIAAGKARPMVVMMIDGHPFTPAAMRAGASREAATAAFRRELLDEALPLVESRYRVAAAPAQRGIVGLSMGGGQSITVGLGNLDRFAWVGAFSGSAPDDTVVKTFLADPAAANAKLKLLWFACGKDDALHTRNEEFDAKLTAAGIKHQWQLTPGNHSWPVWRNYLVEFLPLLFQPSRP